jgi:hypothetical protein
MEESNKASKSKIYILDLDNNSDKEKIKKEKTPWPKRVERCNFCRSQMMGSAKHRDGVYLTSERLEII